MTTRPLEPHETKLSRTADDLQKAQNAFDENPSLDAGSAWLTAWKQHSDAEREHIWEHIAKTLKTRFGENPP